MKKLSLKTFIAIVITLVVLTSLSVPIIYYSHTPVAVKMKGLAKKAIGVFSLPPLLNPTKGLDNVTSELKFEDSKMVYVTNETKRLINYAEGYYFDVPSHFNLSYSNTCMTASDEAGQIVVTREWAFDRNVDEYISHYLNRFILSPEYQMANNITLTENSTKGKLQVITAIINDFKTSPFDTYTYAIFKTKTQNFYRIMFKYNSQDTQFKHQIDETLKTFKYFSPHGKLTNETAFAPSIPSNWSVETNALYKKICESKQLSWGIFTEDIYNKGIDKTVPELENKLEFKFPVILSYLHFDSKFPLEFMQKNYADNKLVELTYQITSSNNEELFGYTPFLDVYRGKKDEEIRNFARNAKEFGHPFLFRLNNEANSDWTSYSGVVNMSDPEIYVQIWRRFYRIFNEEGVNNAIWIFNPNDRNYPPCNWNDFTAYYPGNDYVQMIGVTGYNNGTYYDGEKWREFDTIYEAVRQSYMPMFEKFPWIITEFSSSSVGGDKGLWIKNMFKNLYKYPQIKIAVWFSYADYNVHSEDEKIVSRPYWLDETAATLSAFKDGLKGFSTNSLFDH